MSAELSIVNCTARKEGEKTMHTARMKRNWGKNEVSCSEINRSASFFGVPPRYLEMLREKGAKPGGKRRKKEKKGETRWKEGGIEIG